MRVYLTTELKTNGTIYSSKELLRSLPVDELENHFIESNFIPLLIREFGNPPNTASLN